MCEAEEWVDRLNFDIEKKAFGKTSIKLDK